MSKKLAIEALLLLLEILFWKNRYLKWAETCYKTCHLFYSFKVFEYRKNGATPFLKNNMQRMSPNFVHFMYLFFGRILLRRKFWGIPLRCNVLILFEYISKQLKKFAHNPKWLFNYDKKEQTGALVSSLIQF